MLLQFVAAFGLHGDNHGIRLLSCNVLVGILRSRFKVFHRCEVGKAAVCFALTLPFCTLAGRGIEQCHVLCALHAYARSAQLGNRICGIGSSPVTSTQQSHVFAFWLLFNSSSSSPCCGEGLANWLCAICHPEFRLALLPL